MVAPIKFLSGRQQQQKIGVEGSTESVKVLEVVGRTGIGLLSLLQDMNWRFVELLDLRFILEKVEHLH